MVYRVRGPMSDLTPLDMVRLSVGGVSALVSRADATGLVSFLTLMAQQLHAEEAEISRALHRVRSSNEVTFDDWIALSESVRGALLYQSHAHLMIVATIEQAVSSPRVKE